MSYVHRGERLRQLREESGLLQRQVGAAFDIDKAAVSEWETGKSNPDRRKLVKLDELYGGTGEVLRLYEVAPMGDNGNNDDLTMRLAELEALVRRLQDAQRAEVAAVSEQLSEILDRLAGLERRDERGAGDQ